MIQSTYKILSQIISRCYDFFKTFTFTASVLLRWLFLKHLFDKKQKKPQFNLKMCIFPECHSWSCYVNNWPFAWLGHMVQNRTCWRARPKHCNSYQSTSTCLCFGKLAILYHMTGACKGLIIGKQKTKLLTHWPSIAKY